MAPPGDRITLAWWRVSNPSAPPRAGNAGRRRGRLHQRVERCGLGAHRREGAVGRVDVGTHRLKDWKAQPSLVRHLRVLHLAHQPRAAPKREAFDLWRIRERALGRLKLLQYRHQLSKERVRKATADGA